jgi:hypothetical protein
MDGMMTGDSSRWTSNVSVVLYTIPVLHLGLDLILEIPVPTPSPAPRTIFPRIMVIEKSAFVSLIEMMMASGRFGRDTGTRTPPDSPAPCQAPVDRGGLMKHEFRFFRVRD